MSNNLQRSIILPRAITRFGDHAWDLAMPLILVQLFPGELKFVAAYFLAYTLSVVILVPGMARWLNRQNRLTGLEIVILIQSLGVAATMLASLGTKHGTIELAIMIAAGVLIRLGASLADILVAADWIPKLFTDHTLGQINSRIRRADLIMEVAGPLAAGFALLTPWGFLIIAGVNLVSYLAEYILLKRVYLQYKHQLDFIKTSESLIQSKYKWRSLMLTTKIPIFPFIFANACLWYTVLTPHGAILTAHLKENLHVSENLIGIIRAAGALIGIIPTFYYTRLKSTMGATTFATYHITFQLIMLIIAALSINSPSLLWLAITAIVLSRIGLYGFVLAVVELLQTKVNEEVRMEVNGAATSLKYCFMLIFYLSALTWSEPHEFSFLAWATVIVIAIGTVASWRGNLSLRSSLTKG